MDIYLEIAHIAYIEIKKPNAKPLLFLNPVDKKRGIKFDIPVLINLFANFDMVKTIVGDVEALADGDRAIDKAPHPRSDLWVKCRCYRNSYHSNRYFPKNSAKKGACQEIIKQNDDINLYDLPVLYHLGKRRSALYHNGAGLFPKLRW